MWATLSVEYGLFMLRAECCELLPSVRALLGLLKFEMVLSSETSEDDAAVAGKGRSPIDSNEIAGSLLLYLF